MKILTTALLLSALLSGCASLARQEDCCGAPKEVVYVDKPVAECTRSLRDVTQVSLTILNYFLEFRGVWLQFFQDGTLLNLADVPEYVNGTIIARNQARAH